MILNLYAIITIFNELKCKLVGLNVCKMFIDRVIWIFCFIEFGKSYVAGPGSQIRGCVDSGYRDVNNK